MNYQLQISITDETLSTYETACIIASKACETLTPNSIAIVDDIKTAFSFCELRNSNDFAEMRSNYVNEPQEWFVDYDEIKPTDSDITNAFDAWEQAYSEIFAY